MSYPSSTASYLEARFQPKFERFSRPTAILIACVAAGFLALSSPGFSLATIGASVVAAAAVASRKKLLLILLLAIWYLPGQTAPGGLLESYPHFRWIGLPMALFIAGIYLVEAVVEKRKLRAAGIALPAIAFSLFALASALLNGSGFLGLASTLLLYLRYPLLFIAVANSNLRDSDISALVKAFLFLSFIQIPEVLWRYFALGARWDALTWTLGPWGTFPLGVYCVSSICLLSGRTVHGRFNPVFLAGIPLLLVPALLGEIKSLLIAAPICALVVLFYPWRHSKSLSRRAITSSALIATATAIFLAWSSFWGANDELTPWIDRLGKIALRDAQGGDYSGINRIGWTIGAASNLASKNAILLGQGPGSSLAGNLIGVPKSPSSSALRAGKTQISALLYDTGLLGLSAYVFMLFVVLKRILKSARTLGKSANKSLVYAMLGIWVFYALLGPQYDLVWRTDAASFPFWVFGAGVQLLMRNRSSDSVSESEAEHGGTIESAVLA